MPKEKSLTYLKKFSAIDIGIDNLVAVIFYDSNPFVVNGKPLKSINQYFNKINAKLLSRQRKINAKDFLRTNKMQTLSRKRDNKISDYLHKDSRHIVNQLVSRQITWSQ